MKNTFKVFGTRSLRLYAITLSMLFSFALIACDNGTDDNGNNNTPTTLSGTVTIPSFIKVNDTVQADISRLNIQEGLSYQWQYAAAGTTTFTPINGATSDTYKVTVAAGGQLRVVVTAPAGPTGTVTSNEVMISDENTTAPPATLTGTVTLPWFIRVGATVEANISGLNIQEGLSYRWEYAEAGSNDFTAISGATNKTHIVTFTPTDEILTPGWLRVVVSAPTGSTGTVTSDRVRIRREDLKEPVITSVTITPANPSISKGESLSLSTNINLTVDGQQITSDDEAYWSYNEISWSISGSTNPSTTINNWGTIQVAANETASTLNVRAVSMNPAVFGTTTVTLNNPAGKVIAITGLSGQRGDVIVEIRDAPGPSAVTVASASGTINNGTLAVVPTFWSADVGQWGGQAPWQDSGNYSIRLVGLNYGFDTYVYTNGAALNTTDWNANPSYNIQNATTTINFNLFRVIPHGVGGHNVTVTGLPAGLNGAVVNVTLSSLNAAGTWGTDVTAGHTVISGTTATVSLATLVMGQKQLTGWPLPEGGGNYFIRLTITDGNGTQNYRYTDAKTLAELEIENTTQYWAKAPQFPFSGTTTSVAFDRFVATPW